MKKAKGDIFGLHTVNISHWSEMLKKCCNQAELCGACSATSEGKQGSPDALFWHLVEKYSFALLGMPSAGIRDVLVVSMKEESRY